MYSTPATEHSNRLAPAMLNMFLLAVLLPAAAAPTPSCQAALVHACPSTEYNTEKTCDTCVGGNQPGLRASHCSAEDVAHYCQAVPTPQQWSHSWETAGAAWWGDFGYNLLSEPQAKFIAGNYFMASLEKCTGRGQGLPTEQGIYQTARQLKKYNPKIKVVFYWHTGQAGIGCYAENATFMAHPDWWLQDDYGNVVGHKDSTHPSGQPRIDWTVEAAVAWWVSVPLMGAGAEQLIDGVLADGAGYEGKPSSQTLPL
jgi:hypothetical protein